VHAVGSLKYDAARLSERTDINVPELLRRAGAADKPLVLLGGSTHDGEEKALAEVYLRLKKDFPNLFLVVVPRHFERGRKAGDDLKAAGVSFVFRSEFTAASHRKIDPVDCLLVNTTGELRFFYQHADVVFVGKSLTAEGGQNPIEPASMGRPLIFGPNMGNFPEIAPAFLKENAACEVHNIDELADTAARLLSDSKLRVEMGKNAIRVVHANQGAMGKTVEVILNRLADEDVYIADPTADLQ
jgi:3-deoxy-D-manno-octulosonic-acid transferase